MSLHMSSKRFTGWINLLTNITDKTWQANMSTFNVLGKVCTVLRCVITIGTFKMSIRKWNYFRVDFPLQLLDIRSDV